MNDTVSMTPRTQLGTQLRNVVVEHVTESKLSAAEVAQRLDVSAEVVTSLFEKPCWDVDLGLELTRRLGVPFRVVHG